MTKKPTSKPRNQLLRFRYVELEQKVIDHAATGVPLEGHLRQEAEDLGIDVKGIYDGYQAGVYNELS